MSNVNNADIALSEEEGQSLKSLRRPLRATMSLGNFEDQTKEENHGQKASIGGTVATPEEFVNKYGGKRVINKILIANNGIAGKKNG